MKNHCIFYTMLIGLSMATECMIFAAEPTSAAAKTGAAITNAPVVIPKSVFNDDPKIGRDPFNPKSNRYKVVVPANPGVTNSPPQVVGPDPSELHFKGFNGELVLINDQVLKLGESASVKVKNGRLKVNYLERGVSSVKVRVEGRSEPVILKLRE